MSFFTLGFLAARSICLVHLLRLKHYYSFVVPIVLYLTYFACWTLCMYLLLCFAPPVHELYEMPTLVAILHDI